MRKYNRRYKDSVFVDLFSNDRTAKDNFLALYNALYNTNYQSTDILKNMRLKQTMYMSFANDVSYLVDNKIIVLAEHQSTVNPNMPLKNASKTDILREYLQRKSREVINMLVAEYDYDTDIAVQRQESLMLGIQQGEARGSRQAKLETAKLMKEEKLSLNLITKITGLSQAEVEAL